MACNLVLVVDLFGESKEGSRFILRKSHMCANIWHMDDLQTLVNSGVKNL